MCYIMIYSIFGYTLSFNFRKISTAFAIILMLSLFFFSPCVLSRAFYCFLFFFFTFHEPFPRAFLCFSDKIQSTFLYMRKKILSIFHALYKFDFQISIWLDVVLSQKDTITYLKLLSLEFPFSRPTARKIRIFFIIIIRSNLCIVGNIFRYFIFFNNIYYNNIYNNNNNNICIPPKILANNSFYQF